MVHHLTCQIEAEHDFITRTAVKKVLPANRHHKTGPLSTSGTTPTSQALINEIICIYQQLARASPHLQPSEHINALFTNLVYICTLPADETTLHQVLTNSKIRQLRPHLRQLCSRGEYLMESAWTHHFLDSTPQYPLRANDTDWKLAMNQQLSKFIYYGNYVDLTRLECHALLAVGAQLKNIVWIGSGPLPMSSIEMMVQHNSTIQRLDNIDMDPEAIAFSSQLNDTLPWPSSLRSRFGYHAMDALVYPDYALADVICLGALVGGGSNSNYNENADTHDDGDDDDDGGEDKLEMIIQVAQKMQPGAWLLVRSAHGLRQLLYPALKPSLHWHTCSRLQGLLEIVLELHPHHDVVNSVLIARRIG
ncbi:unnamed protein product [Absidia cylindrospora]